VFQKQTKRRIVKRCTALAYLILLQEKLEAGSVKAFVH